MATESTLDTPILYDFYGKQYDYNSLAQAADQGLNKYLSTLKRGEKDANEFLAAYANIMAGIKDGSITFNNGRFNDSRARYTNSSEKNKDYYGLMANYIYSKMGLSGLYEKPKEEEQKPWDASTNVSRALIQEIYNSDTPNLQDFLDLDAETDGVRAITNRAARLSSAFLSLADNWNTRFSGYSPEDKVKYQKLLTEAANALKDGKIDPGDYLTLSRAIGNINFRSMMSTGTPKQQATQSAESALSVESALSTGTSTEQTSTEQTTTPQLRTESLSDVDLTQLGNISDGLVKIPTNGLINILRNNLYDKDYKFSTDLRISQIFGNNLNIDNKAAMLGIIQALEAQGALKAIDENNPNLFYIPGTRTKTGTAWLYDKSNNSIKEVQADSVPYLQNLIQAKKEGGILYADSGTSFNNIYSSSGDTGYNTYLNQIFNNDAVLNWMNQQYTGDNALSNYATFVENNVKQRKEYGINDFNNNAKYTPNERIKIFNRDYQNNGNTLNYILFGNSDDEYNNRKGGVTYNMGVNWSRPTNPQGTGDRYNSDTSKAYIDNALGLLTYSRVASLTDQNIKAGGFGKWGDIWKSKGATGAYYYTNGGTQGQWVPTNDTKHEGYVAFNTTPKVETPKLESPSLAQGAPKINVGSPSSYINRTTETNKPSWWLENKQEIIDNVLPLGAEAARLGLSLRTNNKIADIVKKATRPVLKDTYDLYYPITGAFSEMQFRNRQAADLRRVAAEPYTSDASLNAARVLEGNKQATQLEYQGFLADDKEIQRTKAENIKRQEDNIARRTAMANENRESMVKTAKEKANIEALRLYNNYQGIDNFIANNIVAPLKERASYNLQTKREQEELNRQIQTAYDMAPISRLLALQSQLLSNHYYIKKNELNLKLQSERARLEAAHADDPNFNIVNTPEYLSIMKEMLELNKQELNDQFQMNTYYDQMNRNIYNLIWANLRYGKLNTAPFDIVPSDEVKLQNWWKIANNKKGGRLSLSTQYLLNKVIK